MSNQFIYELYVLVASREKGGECCCCCGCLLLVDKIHISEEDDSNSVCLCL